MASDVSPVFNYYGKRPNQFWLQDLEAFLCPQPCAGEKPLSMPLSLNSGLRLMEERGTYEFHLRKADDGHKITLDATLMRDGKVYKTAMTAVRVDEDLYEITELMFDGKRERLDARWEIAKVLAHIGKEQLQVACRGDLPEPHEETGKFSKFRRMLDRWLPEGPIPPMC